MPTTTGPTIAAPVDPKGYRNYFEALAEKVILLAWKGRARIRLWNYWPDSTQWSLSLLPGIHLSRGLSDDNFKYRLFFGWLAWGIDIGLVAPKRVLIHDGKGFKRYDPRSPGLGVQTVDIAPLTETYDPDEANERP